MFAYKNDAGEYLKLTSYTTHTGNHIEIEWTNDINNASINPDRSAARRKGVDVSRLTPVAVYRICRNIGVTDKTRWFFEKLDRFDDITKGCLAALALSDSTNGRHSLNKKLGYAIAAMQSIQVEVNKDESPFASEELPPFVSAEVHSDDRAVNVNFNAALWLSQVSYEELLAMQIEGWSDSESTDAIAYFYDGANPEISEMFSYITAANKNTNSDTIGFSVSIEENDVKAWLAINRSAVAMKLWLAADESDVEICSSTKASDTSWFYILKGIKSTEYFKSFDDALKAAWISGNT